MVIGWLPFILGSFKFVVQNKMTFFLNTKSLSVFKMSYIRFICHCVNALGITTCTIWINVADLRHFFTCWFSEPKCLSLHVLCVWLNYRIWKFRLVEMLTSNVKVLLWCCKQTCYWSQSFCYFSTSHSSFCTFPFLLLRNF